MTRKLLFTLGAVMLSVSGLEAETIHMKDGSIIHGTILLETDGKLFVQTREEKLITLVRSEVALIVLPEHAKPLPSAPEKKRPRPVDRVPDRDETPDKEPVEAPRTPIPSGPAKAIAPPKTEPEASQPLKELLTRWRKDPASARTGEAMAQGVKEGSTNLAYLHWYASRMLAAGETPMAGTVLEVIGEARQPESLGRVLPYAEHPVGEVRAAALRAMGRTRNGSAIPHFMRGLMDADATVSSTATTMLVQSDAAGLDVRTVLTRFCGSANEIERARGAEVAGQVQSQWATQLLVRLLGDSVPSVRLAVLKCEGVAEGRLSGEQIAPRINDLEPEVRVEACRLAGELEFKGAVPDLIIALGDSDSNVAEAALGALKRITGRDFGNEPDKWLEWLDTQGGR